ncbi:D-aminoacyl-tRNA deacylase [Nitratidesulfovibrio sp. 1201_IL3209]|uniref:D-aminoacyl-tRNA deacylase n=1 Tax=Nitratidesulfovibrio sp. 1201_IL3209 TaxID=3084053 RepID=UPI002FDA9952
MRLLLQRARRGTVAVGGETVAAIGPGLVVLAGFGPRDTGALPGEPRWAGMIDKLLDLRVFPDDAGKMNVGLREWAVPRDMRGAGGTGVIPDGTGAIPGAPLGELLLVPQFTLHADCRKGRRPSFSSAAPPAVAARLFDQLTADIDARLPGRVRCGIFAADMDVSLVNWGPVTIWLSDDDLFPERRPPHGGG